MARIDRERQVRWYGREDGLGVGSSAVRAFDDGELWVVGVGGVVHLRGDRFEVLADLSGGGPHGYPRRIFATSAGGTYVATTSGLFRRQGEEWSRLGGDGPEKNVYGLLERGREL